MLKKWYSIDKKIRQKIGLFLLALVAIPPVFLVTYGWIAIFLIIGS